MADGRIYPLAFDQGKAREVWDILTKEYASIREDKNCSLPDQSLVAALSGNSPFLESIIRRKPVTALLFLSGNPDAHFKELLAGLNDTRPCNETTADLMVFLREAKSDLSLLAAAADIAGWWNLEEVTSCLSRFADAALQLSLSHLLHACMEKGELAWPDSQPEPVRPLLAAKCGYFILGMGKLGACELNYSSDIDLIALYDPKRIRYTGKKNPSQCMVKLTQKLVQIMDQRTVHGYVFRTDFNLRPNPSANPLAVSVDSAKNYYRSAAVNWERAAMIKARLVAGDVDVSEEFLETMSAWVWRHKMDFEALRDIASIKTQINQHYQQAAFQFEGYNVKLGKGGIREIEFYAQVNQLLFAGRHPELQARRTIVTLGTLADKMLISADAHKGLTAAYRFLRTLEHRIQMVNDVQTHNIPKEREHIERLAVFCGLDNPEALAAALRGHTKTVSKIYNAFLKDKEAETVEALPESLLPPVSMDGHGFEDSEAAAGIVRGWHAGDHEVFRSERAKALLARILPDILRALGSTGQPDTTLVQFDHFLARLPNSIQLFSVLEATPRLVRLLVRVAVVAPALAEILIRKPHVWDAAVEPNFFASMENETELAEHLARFLDVSKGYQDDLDIVRRFATEQRFRNGVQLLETLTEAAESGETMARLADVVITALMPKIEAEFARRYGRFKEGDFAIVAMGKYGGRALTSTSDLDLVFLYDTTDVTLRSDGASPLLPGVYYARLGQRIISALTSLTPEGRLFEVDNRLRPFGEQGPLVSSVKTFENYYQNDAWTWEYMALTRARVILCPSAMKERLDNAIQKALCWPRVQDRLLLDVSDMRKKLYAEFGRTNSWSIKQVRGGLIDIEFICQYLMLKHGQQGDDLFSTDIATSVERLAGCQALTQDQATTLGDGNRLQQNIQSFLRLCGGEEISGVELKLSDGGKHVLSRLAGAEDFGALQARLIETQSSIVRIYDEIIENPAANLLPGGDVAARVAAKTRNE